MPPTVRTASTAGGTVTFTVTGPDLLLVPGAARKAIDTALDRVANTNAQALRRAARDAYPWQAMKDSWHVATTSRYPTTAMVLYTNDPIFNFVEQSVSAHFPSLDTHRGGYSSVREWAEARGLKPYLVALAISRRSTLGKHAIAAVIRDATTRFGADVRAAVTDVLRGQQ